MAKVVWAIELIKHIEKQQGVSSLRNMKLPYVLDFYKMVESKKLTKEKQREKRFRKIRISAKVVANVDQSYFGFRQVYAGFAA